MATYKYKTEELKQKHLEYRRSNYSKNRDQIRERDNETQRRLKELHPERYKGYQERYKERKNSGLIEERDKHHDLHENPDKDIILATIRKEQKGVC